MYTYGSILTIWKKNRFSTTFIKNVDFLAPRLKSLSNFPATKCPPSTSPSQKKKGNFCQKLSFPVKTHLHMSKFSLLDRIWKFLQIRFFLDFSIFCDFLPAPAETRHLWQKRILRALSEPQKAPCGGNRGVEKTFGRLNMIAEVSKNTTTLRLVGTIGQTMRSEPVRARVRHKIFFGYQKSRGGSFRYHICRGVF